MDKQEEQKKKPEDEQEEVAEWVDVNIKEPLAGELIKCKFERPTSFQFQVLDQILSAEQHKDQQIYQDIKLYCVSAPGGKGKTICFLIPAINHILSASSIPVYCVERQKEKGKKAKMLYKPQVIILCHSLPLVHQTAEVLKTLIPQDYKPDYNAPKEGDKGKFFKDQNNKVFIETIYRQKTIENYGPILVGIPTIVANLITGKCSDNSNQKEDQKDEENPKARENLHKIQLDDLKYLIVDEADQVIETFFEQVSDILKSMGSNKKNNSFKIITATATIQQKMIFDFVEQLKVGYDNAEKGQECKQYSVKIFNYANQQQNSDTLNFKECMSEEVNGFLQNSQFFYQLKKENGKKQQEEYDECFGLTIKMLEKLYTNNTDQVQVLIFADSAIAADNFAAKFKSCSEQDNSVFHKLKVMSLTKNQDNNQAKIDVFDQFRMGKIQILVTTNMMARGVDIRTVCLVINMFMPRIVDLTVDKKEAELDPYMYYHRIARVGRFQDKGVVLSFCKGGDFYHIHDDQIFLRLYNSFIIKYKLLGRIENKQNIQKFEMETQLETDNEQAKKKLQIQSLTQDNLDSIISKVKQVYEFNIKQAESTIKSKDGFKSITIKFNDIVEQISENRKKNKK